jgi:hypothetical protein
MSQQHSVLFGVLALAGLLAACDDTREAAPTSASRLSPGQPSLTLSSGSVSKLLGRANFSDPKHQVIKVMRKSGDWHFDLEAKPSFDIAVQTIDFAPGATSGWHSHPGPVFIQVVSGRMTFYDSSDPSCTPIVRSAGEGFLDLGEDAHIARNETNLPAQNVVTYFAPPGAALRIDQPAPKSCHF